VTFEGYGSCNQILPAWKEGVVFIGGLVGMLGLVLFFSTSWIGTFG